VFRELFKEVQTSERVKYHCAAVCGDRETEQKTQTDTHTERGREDEREGSSESRVNVDVRLSAHERYDAGILHLESAHKAPACVTNYQRAARAAADRRFDPDARPAAAAAAAVETWIGDRAAGGWLQRRERFGGQRSGC